jgi:cellulose synthase (UDP-forming)
MSVFPEYPPRLLATTALCVGDGSDRRLSAVGGEGTGMTTVTGERGADRGDAADAPPGTAHAAGTAGTGLPAAPVTPDDDLAATTPMAAVIPAAVGVAVSDAPPPQAALAVALPDTEELDPVPADRPALAALPELDNVAHPAPAALPERDDAARPAAAPARALSRLKSFRRAPAQAAAPAQAVAPAQAAIPVPAPAPVLPRALALPVPPTDAEKYSYVHRHQWLLTLCALICFPPVIYTQYAIIRATGWWWLFPPFALFTIMIMMMVALDGFSRGFDLDEHKRLVAAWKPERYPSVDVFLPVYGEPVDVLRNTWKHVAIMARHYPGEVAAYVLDDAADPELKKLAQDMGFAYVVRPNRGWFKKAGNLNYGFAVADGEYILLLDADFTPRADLLDEVLPYMDAFPQTGIVQTPQFFRVLDHQTWIERGGGTLQEHFFRSIQTSRTRKGAASCCGSCAVYRREALQQNGGMSLAEHSEDLHTGFDLMTRGWQLRYLPISLATGNSPDNVLAFLNQQYRWCSGTLSLVRSRKFRLAKLPLTIRMLYLHAYLCFLNSAVYTFLGPALAIVMLLFIQRDINLRYLVYTLPVLFYGFVVYPYWHHAPYRLEAWSVRLIVGWSHVFVYWDLLRGKPLGWTPSGSKKQDGRRRFWTGMILWSGGSALAWTALAFWRMVTMSPYDFIGPFILGVFQLAIVSRAILQPRPAARG